jgi:hypothetical protein
VGPDDPAGAGAAYSALVACSSPWGAGWGPCGPMRHGRVARGSAARLAGPPLRYSRVSWWRWGLWPSRGSACRRSCTGSSTWAASCATAGRLAILFWRFGGSCVWRAGLVAVGRGRGGATISRCCGLAGPPLFGGQRLRGPVAGAKRPPSDRGRTSPWVKTLSGSLLRAGGDGAAASSTFLKASSKDQFVARVLGAGFWG